MWAQGWDLNMLDSIFDKFTGTQVKQRAGKGVSMPCISMCLAAYHYNPYADWWAEEVPEELPCLGPFQEFQSE